MADFLKTNLTKTAVISVKYCQMACFLMPEKLQNYINKEKGKEKMRERGEGKGEKRKKHWLHS